MPEHASEDRPSQPRSGSWRALLARHWPKVLGCLWFPFLYLSTLNPTPSRMRPGPEPFDPCLICGLRGTADAILNLWFFVPLGLLAVRRLGVMRTAALGVALSVGIEMAQLGIAGRYSTLADIVWNGAGALLGAVLYAPLARLARGVRPRAAVGVALAAAVGGATLLGGWLLEASPTRDAYWGQWTPDFGTRYSGEVLDARFNEHPFPSARLPDTWSGPEMLLTDWTLAGTVVKGPPPRSFTPLLSIYDGHQREVLFLGAFGENLLLRERMRAQDFHLDQPEFMAYDVLADVEVGDTMVVAGRRVGHDRCLVVGEQETCSLGFTPGRLWGLLGYPSNISTFFGGAVDVLWLVALFFPLGFFARTPPRALLNAGIAGGVMAVAVGVTRLVPGPWTEVLAGLAGVTAGLAAAALLRFTATTGRPSARASDGST